jgi:multiple sugar transport system substrate-binding protein
MVSYKYKTTVFLMLLFLLAASLITACAPSTEEPAPAEEAPAAPAEEAPAAPAEEAPAEEAPAADTNITDKPVSIEFWYHEFLPQVEFTQELINAYTAEHPNVTINMTYAPLVDYTQKLSVGMATGTGPDLYDLGTWFLATYQNNDMMAPVDLELFGWDSIEDAKAAYLPGTLDGLIKDDQLLAIPIQMNSFSLFINNKAFTDAGLDPVADAPKTWDELIEVGKQVQTYTADGAVDISAYDFSFNGPNWHMFMFEPILHQYGGEILDENGNVIVNNEAGVKALTLMKRIYVDEKLGDPVRSNAAGAKDTYFEDGKRAMWQTGPFGPRGFAPEAQIHSDGYTVMPWPQVDGGVESTLLYGFVWTVNPASDPDKQKVAWDFTRFAATQPTEWLKRCGFFQPILGWTDTPEAQEIPFLDVYTADAERGRYLVVSEYYNEISQAIMRAMDKVFLEGADPQAALDVAAEEINAAMGK